MRFHVSTAFHITLDHCMLFVVSVVIWLWGFLRLLYLPLDEIFLVSMLTPVEELTLALFHSGEFTSFSATRLINATPIQSATFLNPTCHLVKAYYFYTRSTITLINEGQFNLYNTILTTIGKSLPKCHLMVTLLNISRAGSKTHTYTLVH